MSCNSVTTVLWKNYVNCVKVQGKTLHIRRQQTICCVCVNHSSSGQVSVRRSDQHTQRRLSHCRHVTQSQKHCWLFRWHMSSWWNVLCFWTGNTVSNLIMILPPICGAIQTYRDGLEFRYICSFLGLAGQFSSHIKLDLLKWQCWSCTILVHHS